MRNKSSVISTVLLILAFSAYWASKHKKLQSTKPNTETEQLDKSPSSAVDAAAKNETDSAVEANESAAGRGWARGAGETKESLRAWLAQESRVLDNPNLNSEEKQKEIARVAEQLNSEQASLLLTTALSDKAPAGQKILATYLLVQGGEKSESELRQLIAAPLKDHGPAEAHSHAEAAGIRDKSLRIMAIDGLFSRAQKDSKARASLAETVSVIQDPYIKSYAEKQLRLLK